jgi:hypothetical protein
MTKKFFLIVFLFLFFFSVSAGPVEAGFGISPPYVKTNKPIRPGGHYEQRITLLRSTADETLEAHVQVKAPEVSPWITIDKGNVFDLPQGELQVPMVVRVDVPESAEIGDYKGHINIKIRPKQDGQKSGVAIALGARVDIDLTVSNETFIDFKIRKVDLLDIERPSGIWDWKIFSYFFYRNKVDMKIENTGNVAAAPTRVNLEVYNLKEDKLLETRDDTSLDEVEPFEVETITADFPTDLGPGQYWGHIKIYNENDIIHKDKATFTVYAPGQKPGGVQMGIWPWVMLGGLVLLGLIILGVFIRIRIWRYGWQILLVVTWPLRFLWRKLRGYLHGLKVKFWKWMHSKASQYQEDISDNDTELEE